MIAQTNERANVGALSERDFDGTKLHRVTVLDGCKCSASHMGGKCTCEVEPVPFLWEDYQPASLAEHVWILGAAVLGCTVLGIGCILLFQLMGWL